MRPRNVESEKSFKNLISATRPFLLFYRELSFYACQQYDTTLNVEELVKAFALRRSSGPELMHGAEHA